MNWRKLLAKLVNNWPAKVLSLALAIILFVFHRVSSLETRFFSAPITIEHLYGMMPSSPYAMMIRVSLRGETQNVHSILEDDIEVYVDMANNTAPGAYIVPVQWRTKGTAQGVQPLQISVDPREISLVVDTRISKLVPVSANFRGQVDAGYVMSSYNFNPPYVIVDGPAEFMGSISELHTELIDLDGRRNDFSISVNILRSDPLIAIRGNGTTELNGKISQIIPIRDIRNVPIAITGIREGFRAELEIQAASIHLEGDNLYAVNNFIPSPEFLRIDCSGISEPGTYVLRVLAGSAENIIFRTEPMEVTVRISLEEDEEL